MLPLTHGKHEVMSTFDLIPQDLLKLNDADLRDLIRRLCEAELTSQNLPTSAALAEGAQEVCSANFMIRLTLPEVVKSFIF